MSSAALSAVFEMKDLSADEFRIMVWLAEHDSNGHVHVTIARLVEKTMLHEQRVVSFLMNRLSERQGFEKLGVDNINDTVAVRGTVDWDNAQ